MDLRIIVLLIAGLLVVISLVQPVAIRLGLSFAVLLAVVGVGMGLTASLVVDRGAVKTATAPSLQPPSLPPASLPGPGFGPPGSPPQTLNPPAAPPPSTTFKQVVEYLPGYLHSDVFLYVFLPLLLFQSALTIEVRQIVEDTAPILLLAVVAVLVATFVIGYALKATGAGSLVACLMLGSIVATTDPVAVIGIFRDVGAPSRLSRLVEGESLLNDAAAITLFTLLQRMLVSNADVSVGAASLTFLVKFLGGIAIGYIGARLIVALLPWLHDLRLAQITTTLALPYLVYIGGEHLGASGVVAAVSSGLTISVMGQPRISPSDWRLLQDLWEQLAFWASSLIFILAALLVPQMLVEVGWHDVRELGVLIVAAMAARAIVLFGLLPTLSALGLSEPVNNRYKGVILWGALRGAVTLALALAVKERGLNPHDEHFIQVLATGFVLFTLLVNGTTLRLLIRLLGLDRLSALDSTLRYQVLALSRGRVAEAVKTAGASYKFAPDLVADVAHSYGHPATTAGLGAVVIEPMDVAEGHRMLLGLVAMANRERELVLRHFEERTVSSKLVKQLLADADQLIDRARAGQAAFTLAAQRLVGFSQHFRFAHFLHRRVGIDGPLVDALADRFESLLVNRIVQEELGPFIDDKLAVLVGERVAPQLHDILRQCQDMTRTALEAMRTQYPDYALVLERRLLSKVALRRQDQEYRALFEGGVIGPELYGVLRHEVQTARFAVDERPRLDLGLEARSLIAQVPMFANLTQPQLDRVARLLRPRFEVPGEQLIRRGDQGDEMYFISSGAVEVNAVSHKVRLGRGDFFGEMALLSGQPRQADVFTLSYCQ
ncbi:MAG TPA: cation:proton antiporter [Candidatus Binataceae bacterium]|nr:cation:proton antiporter [Candidatus Binataceae bacterium]